MLFFTLFFGVSAVYDCAYLYHSVRTKQPIPAVLAALLLAASAAAYIIVVK